MGSWTRRGACIALFALVAVLAAGFPASSQSAAPEAAPAAEGVRRPVRLVDIGRNLGFSRQSHSWDLVVGHVDDDGVPDLVVSDHAAVSVYRNRPRRLELLRSWDGFFSDPHGCAIGDIDGNGLGDVYCTQGAERGAGILPNRLMLHHEDGTWTQHHAADFGVNDPAGRGRRVTFADLDHQGGLDLVVGNEVGRTDGEVSVNRTFLQHEPGTLVEQRLGPIGNKGAVCLQAADQNRDGWQDLLICGGSNQPGQLDPKANRLYLFRNRPDGEGGRRLVAVAGRLGIALRGVRSAQLARLNGDGILDLVVVTSRVVSIWPGNNRGGFDPPAFVRRIAAGNWVTVGDVDGRRGRDIFIVQGCTRSRTNVNDLLLLHDRGFKYRAVGAPRVQRGCGDTAAMLDLDRDGAKEIIVGNGRWASRGPIQVLTAGRWRGAGGGGAER